MHLTIAQINPTIGDLSGNTTKILHAIQQAKQQGAKLVLFPELAVTGYPPEDFLLLPQFLTDTSHALDSIIAAATDIAVVVGVVRSNSIPGEKPLCNSAAIIENGQLIGFQDKMLLPTYDVFDERRFFEPAHNTKLWTIAGQQVGITICEDIWQHSELVKYSNYLCDPVKELSRLSPQLVLNLSASPFSLTQQAKRLATCQNAAKTLSCPLILCNQVGGNDSLIFDGHSLFIAGDGTLIDCAKEFEEDVLSIDTTKKIASKQLPTDPDKSLYNALVLGIRDYFHKSGFHKACLGLSGGIDSAVVACLAAAALGKENVLGVLMPSRYSSSGSITDALQLAQVLGIKTTEISIEGPFKSYLELLPPHFEGRPSDITEENMQARIRGMILMALSNKLGYIVLSTGNKSELAMGYSTLYGDMCGGLGPIFDVTKQQVYALARWINRRQVIIPQNTIDKPPSAELRPNQKDSDSLPDYAILDNVLVDYLEKMHVPSVIAADHGYPIELVEKLISHIHKNEFKRRQAPPGLRVSEKAFSVGRRFPIVQHYY